MNALTQFTPGAHRVWNGEQIAVPEGVWVYDTEANVIKIGNGIDVIGSLPVYWDLATINSTYVKLGQLPVLIYSYPKRILVVNTLSTGYSVSAVSIDDLVTVGELLTLLSDISDASHMHADRYYTRVEIELLVKSRSGLSERSSDVISYLLLDAMAQDDLLYGNVPNGIADEFINNSGIDTVNTTGAYDAGTDKVSLDHEETLVTTTSTSTSPVIETKVSVRYQSVLNDDSLQIEVSRDGGVNYCLADPSKLPFSSGSFQHISGTCEFDRKRAIEPISLNNIALHNNQGTISTITVDTENLSGHLNTVIDDTYLGCKLSTLDGDVVITRIIGTSTAANSVHFSGMLEVGAHDISRVDRLEHSDNVIKRITTEVDGYRSIRTDMPLGRDNASTVILDGIIYMMGGRSGATVYNDNFAYDLAKDLWTRKSPLPAYLFGHATVAVGSYIYVLGGMVTDASCSSAIYRYDTITDTWIGLGSHASLGRGYHSCVYSVLAGKIYIHGGYDGSVYLSTTWSYTLNNDTYTELAMGNLARGTTSCVLISNKIYVGLGWNGVQLSDMYVYDIDTNIWTELTVCPTARYHTQLVSSDTSVYLVGGMSTAGTDDTFVYRYNTVANTWTKLDELSTKIVKHGCVVYNNSIYTLFGNLSGTLVRHISRYELALDRGSYRVASMAILVDGGSATDYGVYDVTTDEVTPLVSGATRITQAQMCHVDNKLYIYGGYDGTKVYNSLWSYDLTTEEWTVLSSNFIPRYAGVMIVIGRSLYAYGGKNASGAINDLSRYDIDTDTWVTLANGPGRRYDMAGWRYGNKLYICGGRDNTDAVLATTHVYNPVTDLWSTLTSCTSARFGAQAVVRQQYACIIGGHNGTIPVDTFYSYNILTDTWSTLEALPITLYHHQTYAINNDIYVIGGTASDGSTSDAIYRYDGPDQLQLCPDPEDPIEWSNSGCTVVTANTAYGSFDAVDVITTDVAWGSVLPWRSLLEGQPTRILYVVIYYVAGASGKIQLTFSDQTEAKFTYIKGTIGSTLVVYDQGAAGIVTLVSDTVDATLGCRVLEATVEFNNLNNELDIMVGPGETSGTLRVVGCDIFQSAYRLPHSPSVGGGWDVSHRSVYKTTESCIAQVNDKLYVYGGKNGATYLADLTYIQPILSSAQYPILTITTEGERLDLLHVEGSELDKIYVMIKMLNTYYIFRNMRWYEVVTFATGWKYKADTVWVATSSESDALMQAARYPSNRWTLAEVVADRAYNVQSNTVVCIFDQEFYPSISEVTAYTNEAYVSEAGSDIKVRLTNLKTGVIDVHGMTTRWND